MFISQDLSFHRTLPSTTFEQLAQLLHQMAQVVEEAVVLTEAVLLPIYIPSKPLEQFTVILSQGFSALLVGSPSVGQDIGDKEDKEDLVDLGERRITNYQLSNQNYLSIFKNN